MPAIQESLRPSEERIIPKAIISLSQGEVNTGRIDPSVDHFGEVDPNRITINSALTHQIQGIVNVFTADAIMEGYAIPRKTDVSHIAAMSDQTLTDFMNQPVEPKSDIPRRTFRPIPKAVGQVVVAGAGATIGVIVAPGIFDKDNQSSVQATGILVTGGGFNPAAECIKDDPNAKPPFVLYMLDPYSDYAKGIASGEITIKIGKPPIAALEEGAETAVITGTPVEEVLQNLIIPVEDCAPEPMPDATTALNNILNQDNKDIDAVKPGKIRGLVDTLWAGNPELDTFIIPPHPDTHFSKQYIEDGLDYLFNKKADFRTDSATGLIAILFTIYDWEEKMSAEGKISLEKSIQARKLISELVDRVYDYSIIEITVRNKEALRNEIASKSRNTLAFDLSYPQQV